MGFELFEEFCPLAGAIEEIGVEGTFVMVGQSETGPCDDAGLKGLLHVTTDRVPVFPSSCVPDTSADFTNRHPPIFMQAPVYVPPGLDFACFFHRQI